VSTLIVAFDGLDINLIQRYDCETFLGMGEFGRIDNISEITAVKTPELFAGFVTGRTFEEHGIDRYKTSPYGWLPQLIRPPEWMRRRVRGLTAWNRAVTSAFKFRVPGPEDIRCPTLFDQVPNSASINVPVVDGQNTFMDRATIGLKLGRGMESVERDVEAEHLWRKKELFGEIGKDHQLLMAHFHKPDIMQHLYAYDNEVHDEKRIKQVYEQIDELAAELKRQASEKYDRILFMSDHGLPTETEHNENAFYSCNRELFADRIPHITDFYPLIVEKERRRSETADSLDI